MQARYEVIESRVWRAADGRTASIYGALPYRGGEAGRVAGGWEIVSRGWTVRDTTDGTVGWGPGRWATEDEAQAWADRENARLERCAAEAEQVTLRKLATTTAAKGGRA